MLGERPGLQDSRVRPEHGDLSVQWVPLEGRREAPDRKDIQDSRVHAVRLDLRAIQEPQV